MSSRRPLHQYLRKKTNFLIFSVLIVGVPAAVVLVLLFGRYGDIAFRMLIVMASLAASLAWGLLMWKFFAMKYPGFPQSDD
jgi:hypothetical protein